MWQPLNTVIKPKEEVVIIVTESCSTSRMCVSGFLSCTAELCLDKILPTGELTFLLLESDKNCRRLQQMRVIEQYRAFILLQDLHNLHQKKCNLGIT